MPDQPTIAELLDPTDDYRKLREAVGSLQPGPWLHSWGITPGKVMVGGTQQYYTCGKCKIERLMSYTALQASYAMGDACSVPDPATGSIPDIAERLVKKCNAEAVVFDNGSARVSLEDTVFRMCPETAYEIWAWFGVVATPAERVACCLVALGEARMKK